MNYLKAVGNFYISIGMLFGFVKLMSTFTWGTWHLWASLPTIGGENVAWFGTQISGFLGALFAIIAWPYLIYQWLSGMPLTEVMLFPWFSPSYD